MGFPSPPPNSRFLILIFLFNPKIQNQSPPHMKTEKLILSLTYVTSIPPSRAAQCVRRHRVLFLILGGFCSPGSSLFTSPKISQPSASNCMNARSASSCCGLQAQGPGWGNLGGFKGKGLTGLTWLVSSPVQCRHMLQNLRGHLAFPA